MDVFQEIEAVYRRALILRQYASESPVQEDLLEKALLDLYLVLEELQTAQEELHQQNQKLIATQQMVELEHQRYQALFDLAPNGYLVTDLQGKICQVNHHAAAQLFNAPPAYLIDKPLLVFIHEADRPNFINQLANLAPNQTGEVRLTPRNSAMIWAAITVIRIQSAQTHKDMLLWSLQDITRRKELESQLQHAYNTLEMRLEEKSVELDLASLTLKQEFDKRQQAEPKISLQLLQRINNRRLMEQAPDQSALVTPAAEAMFVQDFNHRILFWSKGAEHLYGWAAADILGKSADILFPQNDSVQLSYTQLTSEFALPTRVSWQGQVDQITHYGSLIAVESRWDLVQDAAGQPQSILVLNTAKTSS
jgi:two-component system, cell cycle sensor histidine kinase and response regulator CckA